VNAGYEVNPIDILEELLSGFEPIDQFADVTPWTARALVRVFDRLIAFAEQNLEGAENPELIAELTTVNNAARAGKACTDSGQIMQHYRDAMVSCRLACYLLNPRYVLWFDAVALWPCAA
jgi:hypothetical protein